MDNDLNVEYIEFGLLTRNFDWQLVDIHGRVWATGRRFNKNKENAKADFEEFKRLFLKEWGEKRDVREMAKSYGTEQSHQGLGS